MKQELALRLLETMFPNKDEDQLASLFKRLRFLAEYKYNRYEMYHPGRLFLENLYLWLTQFAPEERDAAVSFVVRDLVFVSRDEFQQLAHVLYHDHIRKTQLAEAARLGGYQPHRVTQIAASPEFRRVARSSLYIAMSDGARIDHLRRQHLDIHNEQVFPYYQMPTSKVAEAVNVLRDDLGDSSARFRCVFLIDDFCGSGRTLLREVVRSVAGLPERPLFSDVWKNTLRAKEEGGRWAVELDYRGALPKEWEDELRGHHRSAEWQEVMKSLVERSASRATAMKGSLSKLAADEGLREALDRDVVVSLSPLLATEYAARRLEPLLGRLNGPFARLRISPAATLGAASSIVDTSTPIGALCDKYYTEELEDVHTGTVRFGYDHCGLPLVLHHNTPNNSIYLLWARRKRDFHPLFVRYERHGREKA